MSEGNVQEPGSEALVDRRTVLKAGALAGVAAFLAACRIPGFSAAVAFYGGMVGKFADEKPKCPLQMHFGEKDDGIPMDVVDTIKKKQPQAETYVYPGAPHGFHADYRPSYRKEAAEDGWNQAIAWFKKYKVL